MTENCINCDSDRDSGETPVRSRAETGATIVAVITLIDMIAEIVFGILTGSMALLADGIHMGTHAFALLITIAAYGFARKHKNNPAFSFGTGKVGILGGYTNAILLGITAFFMVYESISRIVEPVDISFDEAMIVAVLGLAINAVCAFILQKSGGGHEHRHESGHGHRHESGHGHESDVNLKAAFMHVLADTLTSVLAIAALAAGKYFNWVFLDPLVGLLGAALVLRWSAGLLKETAGLLLDAGDYRGEIEEIRGRIGRAGGEIQDVHIWRYSETERSLVLRVKDPQKRSSETFRSYLDGVGPFAHVIIEVCSD